MNRRGSHKLSLLFIPIQLKCFSCSGLPIESIPSHPTFSLFTITYYFPKIGPYILGKSE